MASESMKGLREAIDRADGDADNAETPEDLTVAELRRISARLDLLIRLTVLTGLADA